MLRNSVLVFQILVDDFPLSKVQSLIAMSQGRLPYVRAALTATAWLGSAWPITSSLAKGGRMRLADMCPVPLPSLPVRQFAYFSWYSISEVMGRCCIIPFTEHRPHERKHWWGEKNWPPNNA